MEKETNTTYVGARSFWEKAAPFECSCFILATEKLPHHAGNGNSAEVYDNGKQK